MNPLQLYGLFEELYKDSVKPYIEGNLPRNKFTEPVYYLLDNFKLRRFRSSFPLILADDFKQPRERLLPIGAASELIFTVALMHDDMIDRDEKRGEIRSAHKVYGVERCIATADFVYSYVMKMLMSLTDPHFAIKSNVVSEVFSSFIESNRLLYESFLIELMSSENVDFSSKQLRELHLAKTIQGTNSLYCAAIVCDNDHPSKFAEKIREYCQHLAIAGQVKNDVYDVTRYAETRGFSDLKNGYMTFPLRVLIDKCNPSEREVVVKHLKKGSANPIVKLMFEKEVLKDSLEECSNYVDKAIRIVAEINRPSLDTFLVSWAEGNRTQSSFNQ